MNGLIKDGLRVSHLHINVKYTFNIVFSLKLALLVPVQTSAGRKLLQLLQQQGCTGHLTQKERLSHADG